MNENRVASCKELVKGLHVCEAEVKAANFRAMMANSKLREAILEETSEQTVSLLDGSQTALTEEEVLCIRTTLAKVKGDTD